MVKKIIEVFWDVIKILIVILRYNFIATMGTTKTEAYTAAQIEIAQLFKAIGHPARIAILEYLIQRKTCVCGEVVDELNLSQSTISQHLKALKEAQIIKGEIEGVKTCYCVNEEKIKLIQNIINQYIINLSATICC